MNKKIFNYLMILLGLVLISSSATITSLIDESCISDNLRHANTALLTLGTVLITSSATTLSQGCGLNEQVSSGIPKYGSLLLGLATFGSAMVLISESERSNCKDVKKVYPIVILVGLFLTFTGGGMIYIDSTSKRSAPANK